MTMAPIAPMPPSRAGSRAMLALRAAMVALAAAGAIGGCDAPTEARPLPDYEPTSLTGGIVYRWSNGSRLRIWTQPDDTPGTIDLTLAVRHAITVWRDVPRFGELTLSTTTDPLDADIIVYDRATPEPVQPGSCAPTIGNASGFTYFCRSPLDSTRAERLRLTNGTVTRASVLIRVDKGRVQSQGGYNALVAHELGHALGIGGHSPRTDDLMFGNPQVDTPSPRDAATLRHLLGLRPDLRL